MHFLLKKILENYLKENNKSFGFDTLFELKKSRNMRDKFIKDSKIEDINKIYSLMIKEIISKEINNIIPKIEENEEGELIISENDYDYVVSKSEDLLRNLVIVRDEFDDFDEYIKESELTREQARLLIRILEDEKYNPLVELFEKLKQENELSELLQKDLVNTFFTDDVYNYINKKYPNKLEKTNEFDKFFKILIEKVLPSSRNEITTKQFAYIYSGHFLKDYFEGVYDSSLNSYNVESNIKRNFSDRVEALSIALKVTKDDSIDSDYNKKIDIIGKHIPFRKRTESGVIDYAIKSAFEDKLMVFRTTNNYSENDVFRHDIKRVGEDHALKMFAELNSLNLEIFEGYKAHKEEYFEKFYDKNNLNKDTILKLKESFDLLIPVGVDFYTKTKTNLILLGDVFYSKEYKSDLNYYKLYNNFLEIFNNEEYPKELKNDMRNLIKSANEWFSNNYKYEMDLENINFVNNTLNKNLLKTMLMVDGIVELSTPIRSSFDLSSKESKDKNLALAIINNKKRELIQKESLQKINPSQVLGESDLNWKTDFFNDCEKFYQHARETLRKLYRHKRSKSRKIEYFNLSYRKERNQYNNPAENSYEDLNGIILESSWGKQIPPSQIYTNDDIILENFKDLAKYIRSLEIGGTDTNYDKLKSILKNFSKEFEDEDHIMRKFYKTSLDQGSYKTVFSEKKSINKLRDDMLNYINNYESILDSKQEKIIEKTNSINEYLESRKEEIKEEKSVLINLQTKILLGDISGEELKSFIDKNTTKEKKKKISRRI